jgi:hypothetical protein
LKDQHCPEIPAPKLNAGCRVQNNLVVVMAVVAAVVVVVAAIVEVAAIGVIVIIIVIVVVVVTRYCEMPGTNLSFEICLQFV